MDVSMPVLKGFDATRRIKARRYQGLILTVYDADEDMVARFAHLDAGATGTTF